MRGAGLADIVLDAIGLDRSLVLSCSSRLCCSAEFFYDLHLSLSRIDSPGENNPGSIAVNHSRQTGGAGLGMAVASTAERKKPLSQPKLLDYEPYPQLSQMAKGSTVSSVSSVHHGSGIRSSNNRSSGGPQGSESKQAPSWKHHNESAKVSLPSSSFPTATATVAAASVSLACVSESAGIGYFPFFFIVIIIIIIMIIMIMIMIMIIIMMMIIIIIVIIIIIIIIFIIIIIIIIIVK
jgi:hypothetical protein